MCAQAHAVGLILQAAFPQVRGWGAARSWSTLCCLLNVSQSIDVAEITCPGIKDASQLGRRAIALGETCERSWMQSSIMLAV